MSLPFSLASPSSLLKLPIERSCVEEVAGQIFQPVENSSVVVYEGYVALNLVQMNLKPFADSNYLDLINKF